MNILRDGNFNATEAFIRMRIGNFRGASGGFPAGILRRTALVLRGREGNAIVAIGAGVLNTQHHVRIVPERNRAQHEVRGQHDPSDAFSVSRFHDA